jgi:hypothetical protein
MMIQIISSLLLSPIIGFCAVLFTSGLVYGLLNDLIKINFPGGGGIEGKNKKDK